MRLHIGRTAALAAALSMVVSAASAADLKIGHVRGNPSVDPHWMTSIVNLENNASVFEPLVRTTNDGKMGPWLAKSWKVVDDTTWEFELQPDAKWHDGKPFTAEDVKFTYERARNVPGAPSSYANYLRQVKEVEVLGPKKMRIHTDGPAPTMLNFLISVLIVSKHVGEAATTDDYHSGKAMIGTGPYKFASWTPNDTVKVVRNDGYWGGKPAWDSVTWIGMPNDASRIAALLSGDIDVATGIPPQDVARLSKNPKINVFGKPANRMIYMSIDAGPEALETGKVLGPNGEKLDKNPLADAKVREALKVAIDLNAMVKKVYLDLALATGQLLHPHMFGFVPDIGVWQPDPEKAKKLLAESGWAGKFKVILATSDSAFTLSIPAVQAVAQMWSRAGVKTEVATMPHSTFLKERNGRQLPIYLASWTNPAGTGEDILPPTIHSRDTKAGWGIMNQARYSNPKVDELLETALLTMDDGKRQKMLQDAGRLALADNVIIPMLSSSEMFATRKGVVYKPRNDAITYLENIVPEK